MVIHILVTVIQEQVIVLLTPFKRPAASVAEDTVLAAILAAIPVAIRIQLRPPRPAQIKPYRDRWVWGEYILVPVIQQVIVPTTLPLLMPAACVAEETEAQAVREIRVEILFAILVRVLNVQIIPYRQHLMRVGHVIVARTKLWEQI